jgi:NADPH:quinone reductase
LYLSLTDLLPNIEVISTGSPNNQGTSAEVDFKQLYRKEQVIIGTNSVSHDVKSMAAVLRKLLPLFESGELQLPDTSRHSEIELGSAVEAYQEMARGSRKKFVIVT